MLTTLIGSGVVQTALVYLLSDKAGAFVSNILSRKGLLGLGTKAAKKVAQRRLDRRHAQARDETVAHIKADMARLEAELARAEGKQS